MSAAGSTVPPLKGGVLILVTIALSLATFMQMLDSTISNVAIPSISGDLGASTDEGTWVITAFSMANAISIPLTGRLALRIGELRLFLLSVMLFFVFSFCCGLSSDLGMLITFRVMQGLVAGPLIPLSQSLLLRNYPPEKRTFALAIWSMTVIVAPIFGPILGGYICDNYHWGWIFFINVPMGIVVTLLCATVLKGRETQTQPVKINLLAVTLLVVGVGALQIMLDKGKNLGWFDSSFIVLMACLSALGCIGLIIHEIYSSNRIIDLSLFRLRNFTIGSLCIVTAYMVYSGSIVLLPQLLQEVYRYDAIQSGLAYSPVGLLPLIFAPLIGRYGSRVDMRILVTFSFMVYGVCYYWRAMTFTLDIEFVQIILPQFIQGFAVACFFLPLTAISLSGLKSERFASATSLSNFLRTLSGSIGTALTMTLWSNREIYHHSQLVQHVSDNNPVYDQYLGLAREAGLTNTQTLGYINQLITQQSLLISANEIFYLSSFIFLSLTLLVWMAKPPFNT